MEILKKQENKVKENDKLNLDTNILDKQQQKLYMEDDNKEKDEEEVKLNNQNWLQNINKKQQKQNDEIEFGKEYKDIKEAEG